MSQFHPVFFLTKHKHIHQSSDWRLIKLPPHFVVLVALLDTLKFIVRVGYVYIYIFQCTFQVKCEYYLDRTKHNFEINGILWRIIYIHTYILSLSLSLSLCSVS
jgi:hypothetical protein